LTYAKNRRSGERRSNKIHSILSEKVCPLAGCARRVCRLTIKRFAQAQSSAHESNNNRPFARNARRAVSLSIIKNRRIRREKQAQHCAGVRPFLRFKIYA
jgi:hypothetical protein